MFVIFEQRGDQLGILRGKLLNDKSSQLEDLQSRYRQLWNEKEKISQEIIELTRMFV
jgi:archaellum component FlaC